MKRILFLTNCPSPYRICFFDELGKNAEVTVLFWQKKEDVKDRHTDWFVAGKGNFRQVQLSQQVCKAGDGLCLDVVDWLKQPFDHVVICGYSSLTAVLAMTYCRIHKIPFWLEVDGGLIRQESRLKYRYKKRLVGAADYWFSTGKRTTEFLVHYGAKEERVYCYPFTSLEEKDVLKELPSCEAKAAIRKELGVEEKNVVLSIGQFIQRKGFDVLLKAAADLPRDTGVYIVGGEPTEEYLRLREELGLSNVHFCGFKKKEELARYYQAADFFVLPTREDIWGLVINEAMAFGLPVITTDNCVAGLELVKEGVNGYIVPVDDAAKLSEKMQTLLAADLTAMGEEALKTAQQYTIENMARTHLEIFEGRE